MSRRGWVLFATLSLVWGVPYLMIRIAVADLDPVVVAFGRTAIGGLVLLPLALARRTIGPLRRHWRWVALYTVIEIVGPWWLIGHAETTLTSSTTGLLLAVVPLVAALVLGLSGQEHFDRRRVAGLAVGFAGVATLVGLDISFDDLWSVGALVLSAVGYALGPVIISRKLSDVPPLGVVTVSLLAAAVVYTPFAVLTWPSRIPADAAWSVLGLALICTVVAFLVMFALIAEVGPGRMTVITYVNPAVAIVLGAWLLKEPLTLGMAIGFPLVILGSVLATARVRGRAEPEPEPEPEPASELSGTTAAMKREAARDAP